LSQFCPAFLSQYIAKKIIYPDFFANTQATTTIYMCFS
jgi:hypothetical protein